MCSLKLFLSLLMIGSSLYSSDKLHDLEKIIIQNNQDKFYEYFKEPSKLNHTISVHRYHLNELAKKYEDRWVSAIVQKLPIELCIEYQNYIMLDYLLERGASVEKCDPYFLTKINNAYYLKKMANLFDLKNLKQDKCYQILKSVNNNFKIYLIEKKIPLSKLTNEQQHWIFEKSIWEIVSQLQLSNKLKNFTILNFLKEKKCFYDFSKIKSSLMGSLDPEKIEYTNDKQIFSEILEHIK